MKGLLIKITGSVGSGKSRLAQRIADGIADRNPIIFDELALTTDRDIVEALKKGDVIVCTTPNFDRQVLKGENIT